MCSTPCGIRDPSRHYGVIPGTNGKRAQRLAASEIRAVEVVGEIRLGRGGAQRLAASEIRAAIFLLPPVCRSLVLNALRHQRSEQ